MMPSPADYRISHRGDHIANAYDQEFRGTSSATAVLWQLEQILLARILDERQSQINRSLDFACGTGRILSFVERYVDDCTGVDISPEMLRLAQDNCLHAKLIEGDITSNRSLVEGPFDLITAFRFFLGAQDGLRRDVLETLRSLISPTGYFIANFHMNPVSIRGAIRKAQATLRRNHFPVISVRHARRLLDAHGFEVEEVLGYAHMFYRTWPKGEARLRRLVDRFITSRQLLPELGSSFIVVARPKPR